MATSFATGLGGNNFQSVKPNLNAALYQQPLLNKCRELDRCFTECCTKELHSFLPHLLSNIFGYDHTVGWMLKTLHPTTSKENYNEVLKFLSVNGPLFRLMYRLEMEGDIYEFPISHLPGPTQDLLHSGGLPSFCTIRQQSAVHDGFVLTNAFEYYICHFAYYLIYARNVAQPWTSLQDCLYAVLADHYMAYFLPARDIIHPSHPPSPSHSPSRLPPATTVQQQSNPSQPSPPRLGLLKVTPPAVYQTPRHTEDQTMWRSEVFVQILVDFWLNQSRYDAVSRFDLILHDQFKPSEEHVRVVRMLIKRVHYFANGSSPMSADSHLATITDNMRRSVIPVHFQSSLYFFLLHALKHWCFDVTYRYVIELWLTFIQPWRYLDPNYQLQQAQANNRRTDPVDPRWEPFILSNIHLYSNLLAEFLSRALQLNLQQRNDVEILARVAKVFAQQGLSGYCWKGQVQRPSFSRSFLRASSPTSSFQEDTASIEVVPLFGSASAEAEKLLCAVHDAKSHAQRQLESVTGRRRLPTTHSAPSHQVASPPSTPGGNQGWMSSAWNWLTDEAGGSSVVRSTPAATLDAWKRIEQLLQAIEDNLCIIFQLSPVVVGTEGIDGEGGSPTLTQRMMSPGERQWDSPGCDLSFSQVEPEFEAHSPQLSARGREQVKSGLRTCSGRKVAYRGDPLLQPIRSYENPTLVRALHSVSSFLTDKLSPQLQAIGCSDRLVFKLLRELLAPPPPGGGPPTSEALRTPVRQVVPVPVAMVTRPSHPRVNLRVFASYYTLMYITLALALGYLLNLGVILHLVVVFLVIFIYSVISYRTKSNTA